MIVTQSVTVRVPAKINLQLAVGPVRPDGYHDLVTVFHAISRSKIVGRVFVRIWPLGRLGFL